MVTTIYDGNTLLSLSYCERKIRELTHKHTLISIDPVLDCWEEKQRLEKEISFYKNVKEDLEKVTVEEWISCVKKQMAIEVKKAGGPQKKISFAYIDPCTVMLNIYNVFSTEITFNKTVYSVECVPNEYYDGYLDTFTDITVAKPMAFLEKFISDLQNELL